MSATATAVIRVAWFTALIYGIHALIASVVNTNNKESEINKMFISLIKLIVNHCSVLFLINELNYGWHELIAGAVGVEQDLLLPFANIPNFKCLFAPGTFFFH